MLVEGEAAAVGNRFFDAPHHVGHLVAQELHFLDGFAFDGGGKLWRKEESVFGTAIECPVFGIGEHLPIFLQVVAFSILGTGTPFNGVKYAKGVFHLDGLYGDVFSYGRLQGDEHPIVGIERGKLEEHLVSLGLLFG